MRTGPAEQGGGAACEPPLAPGQSAPFIVTTCPEGEEGIRALWSGGQAQAGAVNLPKSHSSLSSPRSRAQDPGTVKCCVPGTGRGLYLGMAGVLLAKQVVRAQETAQRSSGLVGWVGVPDAPTPGATAPVSWPLTQFIPGIGQSLQHPKCKLRPGGLKDLVQPPVCRQARARIRSEPGH